MTDWEKKILKQKTNLKVVCGDCSMYREMMNIIKHEIAEIKTEVFDYLKEVRKEGEDNIEKIFKKRGV